jgi:uncharacterized protein (TIGR02246 family)
MEFEVRDGAVDDTRPDPAESCAIRPTAQNQRIPCTMNKRSLIFLFLSAALSSLCTFNIRADESQVSQAALIKNAQAFTEAFEKADAKAVAAFWAEDGDYVDLNGRRLQGRPAIENAFKDFFSENKGLKLRIDVNSVRFVAPETAIEDGITSVISPDGAPPSQSRYSNVHVKKDGQWVLLSVRETPYTPPGNYEHLRGLEWAIGEWVDEEEGPEIDHATFEWTPENNFLISTQDVTVKDTLVARSTEWIGWDPATSQVRSWSFVADGAIGEAVWSNQGDQWIIKTNATLPNGKKLVATNIISRNGPDAITWQSKDRSLDGQALPDLKEVKMKRVP